MFSLEFDSLRGQRCCLIVFIAFLVVGCGNSESDDAAFDDGRNWGESVVVASGSNAGIVESLYAAEDDVYVSWVPGMGSNGSYSVWLAHYNDASGWEDGMHVGGNYLSRIAGGGGNVFVTWQADNDDVMVSQYTEGVGLEFPLVLDVLDTSTSQIDLSVGVSGEALVVWSQYDDFRVSSLWSSYYSLSSGWGSAISLGGVDIDLGWQEGIDVDSHGNAMVVWSDSSLGYRTLWASYYSAGSGWNAAESIAIDINFSSVLTMNDAGNAMVIWSDADGCWARQRNIATGWQSVVSVKSHVDGDSCYVAGMDGQGSVIVIWSDDQGVWARHYSVDGDWQSAVRVVSSSDFIGAVSVDVAENGDAILGWRRNRENTQFWSNYYVKDKGWGSAKLVSAVGHVDDTFVSMRKGGGAVAAWRQDAAGETRVMSSFYR